MSNMTDNPQSEDDSEDDSEEFIFTITPHFDPVTGLNDAGLNEAEAQEESDRYILGKLLEYGFFADTAALKRWTPKYLRDSD